MSTKNSNKKSEVWNFFNKNKNNEDAKCLKCGNVIFCKGSSTTALINHLKRHDIFINKKRNSSDELPMISTGSDCAKKTRYEQGNLFNYLNRDSLGEILAKCAAVDGFSIHAIKNSSALKGFLQYRGYEMPKSDTSIMNHIKDFAVHKKTELAKFFSTLSSKNNGQKFSITVDEWTGRNVKRYLNVTLHSKNKAYVLGLMPIEGSCNAVKLKNLVEEKLLCFGLKFAEDIIASTNDGASVMQKYGRLIEAIYQLCFNHSIHLAVIDVFYKQAIIENIILSEGNDDHYDSDENSEENTSNLDTNANINFDDVEEIIKTFRPDIGKTLAETRTVIKKFKNSPVRNSILQNYVTVQEGKNLNLQLDCKTRWNSLIPMIERFLKLKECIKKALNDIGCFNIYKEENEVVLEDILKIMKPTELAVNELSKESATLLTSEGVFKFLFEKLRENNTSLSKELLTALKTRMNERRNETVMTLLLYLQCGKMPRDNGDFTYSSKIAVCEFANNLMNKIYPVSAISEEACNVSVSVSTEHCLETETNELNQELHRAISSVLVMNNSSNTGKNIKDLKSDFKILDGTKKRTENLERLYEALLTIKPTSTATERVFSTAGNFLTKIRSRLNFESLDVLIFLKYYFLNKDK